MLRSTVKALDAENAKGKPFTMYGVFCFAPFVNSYTYKNMVPEAHFRAESIAASPVMIVRKTAK